MENIKLIEQQRIARERERTQNLLSQAFCIIPYQVSGIVDYSNQGFVNYQITPEDAETFKRVWTGNDSCILNWYQSTSLQLNSAKRPTINYKIGDYILGNLIDNDSACEINNDVSFSDYKSQQVRKSITFRVIASSHEPLNDYYQLMLYKIPKYSNNTIFRLANINRIFIGNQLMEYQLTFTSINQDLANTGRAKQQNINMSAPGQGYVAPKIYAKNEYTPRGTEGVDYVLMKNDEYLVVDKTKLINNPVTKCVIKLFGNGILSSVAFIGRPVLANSSVNEWRYQRLIFPFNFSQPSTPTLYRTQTNNTNCYWGGFSPTVQYWKDFISNIKDTFQVVNKWNFEGFLEYNKSQLELTNPKISGGYAFSLFKIGVNNWQVASNNLGVVTTLNSYGVNSNFNMSNTKPIHDKMWDAYWVQKSMVCLPISSNSTLTFGNVLNGGIASAAGGLFAGSKAPFLIGAGIGLFMIGALASWVGASSQAKAPKYYGIVNAPFLDYNDGYFGDTVENKDKILMNMLDSDEGSPSSIFFSTETMNFSFEAQLTDEFLVSQKRYSTGNIGQKTFENGAAISGGTLLVNGNEQLVQSNSSLGYIIDQIQVDACFKGDISIEFLDSAGQVSWSGIYQSQGKWTNSLRETRTLINTSLFNSTNISQSVYNNPLPYPKALPNPTTSNLVVAEITNTTFENSLAYNSHFEYANDTFQCQLARQKVDIVNIVTDQPRYIGDGFVINLFPANVNWTGNNLNLYWKSVQLLFERTWIINNVIQTENHIVEIPFSKIKNLGTNNNTVTNLEIESTSQFSTNITNYQCVYTGSSGGSQGRPHYKLTSSTENGILALNTTINLDLKVVWSEAQKTFILTQEQANPMSNTMTPTWTRNKAIQDKLSNRNTLTLIQAKLLLK